MQSGSNIRGLGSLVEHVLFCPFCGAACFDCRADKGIGDDHLVLLESAGREGRITNIVLGIHCRSGDPRSPGPDMCRGEDPLPCPFCNRQFYDPRTGTPIDGRHEIGAKPGEVSVTCRITTT